MKDGEYSTSAGYGAFRVIGKLAKKTGFDMDYTQYPCKPGHILRIGIIPGNITRRRDPWYHVFGMNYR